MHLLKRLPLRPVPCLSAVSAGKLARTSFNTNWNPSRTFFAGRHCDGARSTAWPHHPARGRREKWPQTLPGYQKISRNRFCAAVSTPLETRFDINTRTCTTLKKTRGSPARARSRRRSTPPGATAAPCAEPRALSPTPRRLPLGKHSAIHAPADHCCTRKNDDHSKVGDVKLVVI